MSWKNSGIWFPFAVGLAVAVPGVGFLVTGMSQKELAQEFVRAEVEDEELQARIDEAGENYQRNMGVGAVLAGVAFVCFAIGILQVERAKRASPDT